MGTSILSLESSVAFLDLAEGAVHTPGDALLRQGSVRSSHTSTALQGLPHGLRLRSPGSPLPPPGRPGLSPAAPFHLPTIKDLPKLAGREERGRPHRDSAGEGPSLGRTYPAPRPTGTAWPWPSCCRSSPPQCCRPPQRAGGPAKRHKDSVQ